MPQSLSRNQKLICSSELTTSLAVSAILGAPLGHDHATLSLSDLHTDWETIERRLRAAAEGDLVTVLYNPRSRTRLKHLPRALEIFAAGCEVEPIVRPFDVESFWTIQGVKTLEPRAQAVFRALYAWRENEMDTRHGAEHSHQ